MAKKEEFPGVMYSKIKKDGDVKYFVAGKDFNVLVDMGETARIAIYNLVEVIEVEGTAVVIS